MPMSPFVAPALASVNVLPPKGLNTSIYLGLNRLSRHTAWAHGFMHAYALWLGLALLVLLFVTAYGVAWWRRDRRGTSLLLLGGLGTVAALGVNQLVGHAAGELRPYDTYRHALVLVGKAHDYAFPSDHAVVAGAIVTAIFLVVRTTACRERSNRPDGQTLRLLPAPAPRRGERGRATLRIGVAATVLGLFLAFARVYVGAHYPGDVVAGLLLGAAVVLGVSLLRPLAYRATGLALATPFRILVVRPPHAIPEVQPATPDARGVAM